MGYIKTIKYDGKELKFIRKPHYVELLVDGVSFGNHESKRKAYETFKILNAEGIMLGGN